VDDVRIASGRTRFVFGDGEVSVEIDVIDALIECAAIAERTKNSGNWEYLDQFAAWVRGQTHGETTLSRGEADALWKAIYLERARSQRDFTEALRSLDSTGSTRSD
jgi:hypothetical protein